MQAIKHWFFMLFHHHEWEIHRRADVYKNETSNRTCGVNYTHRCKICGKMKSETLS